MESKKRKVHVRWVESEIETLAEAIVRMMVNGTIDTLFLKYLKKAQNNLPKERRRTILSRTQIPDDLMVAFKKKVEETLPSIKEARKLIQGNVPLHTVPIEDLIAEINRRQLVHKVKEDEPVVVEEPKIHHSVQKDVVMHKPASEQGPGLLSLRVVQEPQVARKKRIIVIGVLPKEEKKFDFVSSEEIKMDFYSFDDNPNQAPKYCDLCIAITNRLPKRWKNITKTFENHQFVNNFNEAISAVEKFLQK